MNKTKIEWCDSTWNPVTGCRHDCEYCYARKIAGRFGTRISDLSSYPKTHGGLHCLETKIKNNPYPYIFEPTFLPYRLAEPEQKTKPQTIFVCSMADLFGDWVPSSWIEEVFAACKRAPQHRYLFLTKNPARYMRLFSAGKLPEDDNFWYGATAPNDEMMSQTADAVGKLPKTVNTFISVEPMIYDIAKTDGWCYAGYGAYFGWIILGAMTGPGSKNHQPRRDWIEALAQDAKNASVPVLMKESIAPIVGEENMLREFPWAQQPEGAQKQ